MSVTTKQTNLSSYLHDLPDAIKSLSQGILMPETGAAKLRGMVFQNDCTTCLSFSKFEHWCMLPSPFIELGHVPANFCRDMLESKYFWHCRARGHGKIKDINKIGEITSAQIYLLLEYMYCSSIEFVWDKILFNWGSKLVFCHYQNWL